MMLLPPNECPPHACACIANARFEVGLSGTVLAIRNQDATRATVAGEPFVGRLR